MLSNWKSIFLLWDFFSFNYFTVVAHCHLLVEQVEEGQLHLFVLPSFIFLYLKMTWMKDYRHCYLFILSGHFMEVHLLLMPPPCLCTVWRTSASLRNTVCHSAMCEILRFSVKQQCGSMIFPKSHLEHFASRH